MHTASRHGTPNLTSLPKDDEVSCEVRPLRSPIPSLTLLGRAEIQSPNIDCISHYATHPLLYVYLLAKQELYVPPYTFPICVFFKIEFDFCLG